MGLCILFGLESCKGLLSAALGATMDYTQDKLVNNIIYVAYASDF